MYWVLGGDLLILVVCWSASSPQVAVVSMWTLRFPHSVQLRERPRHLEEVAAQGDATKSQSRITVACILTIHVPTLNVNLHVMKPPSPLARHACVTN